MFGCGGGGYPTSFDPGLMSTATGLEFNREGEFQVTAYQGQPYGPNLLFVEGGRTVMGSFEEDVISSRNNIERAVTVASFYMDETEVSNINWLEYEFYIKADSSEEYWKNNLPDTTVWARDLAFNDPYVNYYYRYPGFRYFPVVGVNWRQAVNYCKWRTEIINTKLIEDSGYYDSQLTDEDIFADAELQPTTRNPLSVPVETGIILPNYRLPTEAEWEYAAKSLIATQYMNEEQTHARIYPWDGHALRYPYGQKTQGLMMANYRRGGGDYAGIAGRLNDGAMITTHVYDYWPNEMGFYNMAGNVNEWVYDVYRSGSFQDMDDFNPVRRDDTGDRSSAYDASYSFIGNEKPYTQAEAIAVGISPKMYDPDHPPVKRMRVYKGGGWRDVAYWMAPGTRRTQFEDYASDAIGFRCAMIKTGMNW